VQLTWYWSRFDAAAPVAVRLESPGVVVDRLDQIVDALWREQAGAARIAGIGADVDHPDAVMGVEHVDRVRRSHLDPPAQRAGISGVDRIEGERREHEVVDEIDVRCGLELVEVMAVHLDQDRHRTLVAGSGEAADELQRFGQHEARRAGPFDRVADGIETDGGGRRSGTDRGSRSGRSSRVGVRRRCRSADR